MFSQTVYIIAFEHSLIDDTYFVGIHDHSVCTAFSPVSATFFDTYEEAFDVVSLLNHNFFDISSPVKIYQYSVSLSIDT